jgi:Lon protease-like protein
MVTMERELPLFPLKRVVLFPGMSLPLHIFEERYKIMVGSCQVSAEPFGVVLIRSGEEVGAVARPERIGCTARLVRVDRFPDGTMDILSVGEHRFALQASPRVAPEGYLVGMTRITTDEDLPSDLPADLIEAVVGEFRAYWAELTQRARRGSASAPELPEGPVDLSFRVAAALAVDPLEQQQLLMMDDVRARLERELTLLRRENRPGRTIGPFSIN